MMRKYNLIGLFALLTIAAWHNRAAAASHTNQIVKSSDPTGTLENYSISGKINFQNQDFFTAFGAPGNRRTCASCHLPDQA